MSFFYHELKNHINRDGLSDWFDIMHKKYNCFKKDLPNIFYKEIQKEKEDYKNNFIENFRQFSFFYENLIHSEIKTKIQMKEKFIAYNTTLYSKPLNIYVKPDIIIHRDIFQEYFPEVTKIFQNIL